MSRRKRKTRKNKIFFFIFAGILVFGAYLLSLPIWEIKDVAVNGTKLLSAEEIKALAGIPLSENLFFTSFSRARGNLSKITVIENFKIYRIPPGTVLINIKERKPLAAVVFPNKSVIIDKEGYILNRNPKISFNIPNEVDLPVISGISEEKILKDERIEERAAEVVSNIIFKLSYFLESRRLQLELGGLEKVSFLLDDLLRVKVGSAKDIKRKMEVFEALLPVIAGKWSRVEYVDVRYPDNPVIKYK